MSEPVLNKTMEKFDLLMDKWLEMCVEDQDKLVEINERRCC